VYFCTDALDGDDCKMDLLASHDEWADLMSPTLDRPGDGPTIPGMTMPSVSGSGPTGTDKFKKKPRMRMGMG